MNRRNCVLLAALVAAAANDRALAADYYTAVPFLPFAKIDGEGATPANTVYGKEYSHNLPSTAGDPNLISLEDHDAAAVPDPAQVVSWDGIAGPIGGNSGSVNAFDYSSKPGFPTQAPNQGQVDALANNGDFMFNYVIQNRATLLFSTTSDLFAAPGPGGPLGAHVHWEDPAGGHAPWALIEAPPAGTGPGPGVNHHLVRDLDGLEVWGPEPPSHTPNNPTPVVEGYTGAFNRADSNRFSLDVDSATGTSMWNYDIAGMTVSPYIPHAAIVAAVEKLFIPSVAPYVQETRNQIDVDAAMSRDIGDPGRWSEGDELLFSIDPVLSPFVSGGPAPIPVAPIDGGEIMRLVKTGPLATDFTIGFLSHGGHLWDTAFSVTGKFGYAFEDVDAIEAVGTLTGTDVPTPEPTSMLLLAVGAMLTFATRRK